MSTYKQLIDQVELNLTGFTMDQGEQTFLTAPVASGDLTFKVDEPKLISHGIIQVDDELMWVKRVDNNTADVTISPMGRGYRSTVATSHLAGAMAVDNPKFPRQRIRDIINVSIQEVYPDLYVTKTAPLFPYVAARNTYALPVDAKSVLSVNWQTIGPSQTWMSMKRWRFTPRADLTAYPTGKTIDLWSTVIPGRSIKVDYTTTPNALVNDADVFDVVTGLESFAEEAIVYGACYRLIGWLETPRLQVLAVESTLRSALVPNKSATDAGRYFYAMYQESLSRARRKLLQDNPNSLNFRYV